MRNNFICMAKYHLHTKMKKKRMHGASKQARHDSLVSLCTKLKEIFNRPSRDGSGRAIHSDRYLLSVFDTIYARREPLWIWARIDNIGRYFLSDKMATDYITIIMPYRAFKKISHFNYKFTNISGDRQ